MPRDYMNIGSSPTDEDCAQVGAPDYDKRSREECARFIEVIRRNLGPEPEGAQLSAKTFPHDFGSYREVVCYFELGNEAATEYAYRCESNTPRTWHQTPPETNGADPGPPPPPPPRWTSRGAGVCDSCLEAAAEEGIPDRASQELVMVEMGADLADHLCDRVEAPDTVKSCACACRRR